MKMYKIYSLSLIIVILFHEKYERGQHTHKHTQTHGKRKNTKINYQIVAKKVK